MTKKPCPKCASFDGIKTGLSYTGYQRYRCKTCGRNYSDSPNRKPTEPIGDRPLTQWERIQRMDPAKLAARRLKNVQRQRERRAKKRREREAAALARQQQGGQ